MIDITAKNKPSEYGSFFCMRKKSKIPDCNYHHVVPVSCGGGDATLQEMITTYHSELHWMQNLKDAEVYDFWKKHILVESDRILESATDDIAKQLLESAFGIFSLKAQGLHLTQGSTRGATIVRWARLSLNHARDEKRVSFPPHLIEHMIQKIWTPFFNAMYQHDFTLVQEIWMPQMYGLNGLYKTLSGEFLIEPSDEEYIAKNKKNFEGAMNQLLLEIKNEYKQV